MKLQIGFKNIAGRTVTFQCLTIMDEEKVIDEFKGLNRYAERYISSPNTSTVTAVNRWRNRCYRWLQENLPADSGLAEDFLMTRPPKGASYGSGLSSTDVTRVQDGLKVLLRAKELLPFLRDPQSVAVPLPDNVRNVFVVHGHNVALKESVARTLERLELSPIILHEQANLGRTIIEKFTDHANVAYAVVLLTGDDRGGSVNEQARKFKPRARQNVILEMGYFLGRLGRQRVAAIYEDGVEIPSDYSGVLFIKYDVEGRWQFQLAKEMKAVGLKIDMNKV